MVMNYTNVSKPQETFADGRMPIIDMRGQSEPWVFRTKALMAMMPHDYILISYESRWKTGDGREPEYLPCICVLAKKDGNETVHILFMKRVELLPPATAEWHHDEEGLEQLLYPYLTQNEPQNLSRQQELERLNTVETDYTRSGESCRCDMDVGYICEFCTVQSCLANYRAILEHRAVLVD